MKKIVTAVVFLLLVAACGQSYEETKRITRAQRREAQRKDSAALKIAVMPTLDCLPLYVARHYGLLDTLYGGVRLRLYQAQMDCDTAFQRGRVEGMVSDLVRTKYLERKGMKIRYSILTGAYWQLVTNRQARIRQLKQLDDKMVAMARFSVTDLMTDVVTDSARLTDERVFKVQVNDVNVRIQMLQNNEMDALWLTEPLATQARQMRAPVVFDTRQTGRQLGVIVFNEKVMRHQDRSRQLDLLVSAYNQACDSINKHGVRHYRSLISDYCKVRTAVLDSLPDMTCQHARGPRQEDVTYVEQWIDKKLTVSREKISGIDRKAAGKSKRKTAGRGRKKSKGRK